MGGTPGPQRRAHAHALLATTLLAAVVLSWPICRPAPAVEALPPYPLTPVAEWRYPWLAPASGNVAIVLEGALTNGQADLQLDFTLTADGWAPDVWGYANLWDSAGRNGRSFNGEDHRGRLRAAKTEGDAVQLSVALTICADRDSLGGPASYELQLKRFKDRFEGTYEGTVFGRPVSGKAYGRLVQLERTLRPAAFTPGEHPRLLLREREVAQLRKHAETTEGKAILAKLDEALSPPRDSGRPGAGQAGASFMVARAFQYVLTGDAAHATAARQLAQQSVGHETFTTLDRKRGQTLGALALAYDLCYQAWDEPFRQKVRAYLRREAMGWSIHEQNSAVPHGHQHAIACAGQGLLALAILAEPGGERPVLRPVKPPANLTVGKGVPVIGLEDGQPMLEWLYAGPFTPRDGTDHLASIGGRAKAAPEEGTAVASAKGERTFRTVDGAKYRFSSQRFTRAMPCLSASTLAADTSNSVSYCYAVLDCPAAAVLQAKFIPDYTDIWFGEHTMEAKLFVAGVEIGKHDLIQVEKGRYPLLLEVGLGACKKGGKVALAPRFAVLSEPEAQKELARLQTAHDLRNSGTPFDVDRYLQTGLEDPGVHAYIRAQRGVRRWLLSSAGAIGLWAESHKDGQAAWHAILPYLHCWDQCAGKGYVEGLGADGLLLGTAARIIGKTVVNPDDDAPLDTPGAESSGNWLAGFCAVSPAHRPALRQVFDALYSAAGNKTYDIWLPDHAVYALLNYPFEVAPQPPEGRLPLMLTDLRKGAFTFRNAYSGPQDILLTLYLRGEPLSGTTQRSLGLPFRLYGLGQDWGRLPLPWAATQAINDHFGPRLTSCEIGADGKTAALTTDTSLCYQEPDPEAVNRGAFKDLGVRGARALVCDYSGISGAPALIAIVDTLKGTAETTWNATWSGKIATQDNTFTVTGTGGATLTAVFAPPAGKLAARAGEVTVEGGKDGSYFCVLTLQKGAAPRIEVAGEGLAAKVSVGKRTVSFDGSKIVLGTR